MTRAARYVARLYRDSMSDRLPDSAAALSYYFVFALFPFLFLLTTLTAYLPYFQLPADTLLARVRTVLPPQVRSLVYDQIAALVGRPRPRFLAVSLLLAGYSASRAVDAVRAALNRVHGVDEDRPLWKTEALAFGTMVGGTLLGLIAIAAMAGGGSAGLWLAREVGAAAPYVAALRWLRWPVTAFAIVLCAAFGYHVLPDARRKFKLITPGALLGTVIWLLASWGFGTCAAGLASYDITYGAVGGLFLLMIWFYLTGLIFLVGAEINHRSEQKSGEPLQGTRGLPRRRPSTGGRTL